MTNLKLNVLTRTKKENTKDLIKNGFIPAVLYGPQLKTNKLVKVKTDELNKTYAAAGESTLIDLTVDEKTEGKVLIKDTQINPTKDTAIHADLYKVDMAKEIHANIVLNFIGSSPAVENFDGVLTKNITEVEVKCLPNDLINHIDIDLSVLVNIDDTIKIHGLKLPKGIKLTTETDDVIAIVNEMKIEKEPVIEAPVAEAAPAANAPIAEKKAE